MESCGEGKDGKNNNRIRVANTTMIAGLKELSLIVLDIGTGVEVRGSHKRQERRLMKKGENALVLVFEVDVDDFKNN